jgi:hypothetical protein
VRLRRSPAVTVGLLVSMVFVAGHGGFGFTRPIASPGEIVSLLLDGVLYPESTGATTGGTPC